MMCQNAGVERTVSHSSQKSGHGAAGEKKPPEQHFQVGNANDSGRISTNFYGIFNFCKTINFIEAGFGNIARQVSSPGSQILLE